MHNMLKYGPWCIKSVKITKGAQNQFFKILRQCWTRPWYMAVYSACVQTPNHQKMHQNSFFEVATLAIKAITLLHIQMLNYNTCNSHFKHANQLKTIKWSQHLQSFTCYKFTILANFNTHNYNSFNYESFSM